MATVRAAIGPAADPLAGGVPVAEIQLPAVTSCAVAEAVWVKVVLDVHVTVVAPDNELLTLIDEPDTEATEPDAAGRPLGDVVEDPDEADGVVEAAEAQAALTMPMVTMKRASLGATRHDRSPSGTEEHLDMDPRFHPHEEIAFVDLAGSPALRLSDLAFGLLRIQVENLEGDSDASRPGPRPDSSCR